MNLAEFLEKIKHIKDPENYTIVAPTEYDDWIWDEGINDEV